MAVESVGARAAAPVRAVNPASVEEERRSREPPPEPRSKPVARIDGLGSRVDERA